MHSVRDTYVHFDRFETLRLQSSPGSTWPLRSFFSACSRDLGIGRWPVYLFPGETMGPISLRLSLQHQGPQCFGLVVVGLEINLGFGLWLAVMRRRRRCYGIRSLRLALSRVMPLLLLGGGRVDGGVFSDLVLRVWLFSFMGLSWLCYPAGQTTWLCVFGLNSSFDQRRLASSALWGAWESCVLRLHLAGPRAFHKPSPALLLLGTDLVYVTTSWPLLLKAIELQ